MSRPVKVLRLFIKTRPGGWDCYLFQDDVPLPPWEGVKCTGERFFAILGLYFGTSPLQSRKRNTEITFTRFEIRLTKVIKHVTQFGIRS